MKIYSLLKFLKNSCFIGILLFFFNFAVCTIFSAEFDIMFWVTFPAITYVFISYSIYCIVENIGKENILQKNGRKVVDMRKYREYNGSNVGFGEFEEFRKSSAS